MTAESPAQFTGQAIGARKSVVFLAFLPPFREQLTLGKGSP
jgi:hypothetical protein